MNELSLEEKIGVELLKAKKLENESLTPIEIRGRLKEKNGNINEIIITLHKYFEITVKEIYGKIYPSFKIASEKEEKYGSIIKNKLDY